ncbi:MAG: hypothetical protein HUU02_12220 [Bacteroidetes bacterium]|nr:hypothetical protein [Bacteroidota bacterium]
MNIRTIDGQRNDTMHHRNRTLYAARLSCIGLVLYIITVFAVPSSLPAQNNALWIWNTRQLIDEPEWRDSLQLVSGQLSVNTLFVYLSYTFHQDGDSLSWNRKDSIISLLQWMKKSGFSVHALTGEPEWALPEQHRYVLTYARAAVELQKETGLLDGLQFDIEPYLLLPYAVPSTRQKLLKDWIHVVWKASTIVRNNSSLQYGCAVPFWMEKPVTVDGVTMPVVQHLGFLTDYLAVMAYRYTASGPASVISFSEQERRWAREAGRKIYIGVETQRLPGSESVFLCEAEPDTFAARMAMEDGPFQDYRLKGHKLSVRMADDRFLVGISRRDVADSALAGIRTELIAAVNGRVLSFPFKRLETILREEEEGEKASRLMLTDGHPAFVIREEDQVRSTMFGLSPVEFMDEYAILLRHAAKFPEVEGIAVHDLRSVRRLLEKK